MKALLRFFRRRLLLRRYARACAEIEHIEAGIAAARRHLAREIRIRDNTRVDLVWIDIDRPPVSHAMAGKHLDGVVRPLPAAAVATLAQPINLGARRAARTNAKG